MGACEQEAQLQKRACGLDMRGFRNWGSPQVSLNSWFARRLLSYIGRLRDLSSFGSRMFEGSFFGYANCRLSAGSEPKSSLQQVLLRAHEGIMNRMDAGAVR